MRRSVLLLIIGFIVFDVVLVILYFHFKNNLNNNEQVTINNKQTNYLAILSDTPDFNVTFSDKVFLQNILNENRFFALNTVRDYTTAKTISVDSLRIHLSDKALDPKTEFRTVQEPLLDKTEGEGEALGMKFNTVNHALEVYIYINPQFITKLNNSQLGTFYSKRILSFVYILTHPPTQTTTASGNPFKGELDYAKIVDSIADKSFITIKK